MPSFAVFTILLLVSVVPRVESPLPETIGLGFLVTTAGAGGLLGGIAFACSTPAKREKAINIGGLFGFAGGVLVYLIALSVQLFSDV